MPANQINVPTDGGKAVLDQWQHMAAKSSLLKKNKKRKKKQVNEGQADGQQTSHRLEDSVKQAVSAGKTQTGNEKKKEGIMNIVKQGVANGNTQVEKEKRKEDYKKNSKKERERTKSKPSSDSNAKVSPHGGIEKSCKDLHRHISAIEHSNSGLKENFDRSYKRVSEVFKELRQQMLEREAVLVSQLDQNKIKAFEFGDGYTKRCGDLKVKTDRASGMKENEVTDLRSDIKNLAGERRHFEEMAQTKWFSCQFNELLEAICGFGEVSAIRTASEFRLHTISPTTNDTTTATPTTTTIATPNTTTIATSTTTTIATSTTTTIATPTSTTTTAIPTINTTIIKPPTIKLKKSSTITPATKNLTTTSLKAFTTTFTTPPTTPTTSFSAPQATPVLLNVHAKNPFNSSHIIAQSDSLTRYEQQAQLLNKRNDNNTERINNIKPPSISGYSSISNHTKNSTTVSNSSSSGGFGGNININGNNQVSKNNRNNNVTKNVNQLNNATRNRNNRNNKSTKVDNNNNKSSVENIETMVFFNNTFKNSTSATTLLPASTTATTSNDSRHDISQNSLTSASSPQGGQRNRRGKGSRADNKNDKESIKKLTTSVDGGGESGDSVFVANGGSSNGGGGNGGSGNGGESNGVKVGDVNKNSSSSSSSGRNGFDDINIVNNMNGVSGCEDAIHQIDSGCGKDEGVVNQISAGNIVNGGSINGDRAEIVSTTFEGSEVNSLPKEFNSTNVHISTCVNDENDEFLFDFNGSAEPVSTNWAD